MEKLPAVNPRRNTEKIRSMFLTVTANLRSFPRQSIYDTELFFFIVVPSGRRATTERRGQISSPERRPPRPHRGVCPAG